jgi:hypothetical protein
MDLMIRWLSDADLCTLHSQHTSCALQLPVLFPPVTIKTPCSCYSGRISELLGWHAEFYIRSISLLHSSSTLFKLLASAPKVVIHRPPWNGRGRIGEQRDRVTVRVWVVVAGLSVHREAGRVHVK